MISNRRALLGMLGAAMLVAGAAFAEQASVPKVTGVVTAENFDGLATFLGNSTETVIGLDLSFPEADDAGDGGLVGSTSSDGLFTTYISGPSEVGGTEISAREGVNFQNGANVVDGFFVVKNAGMNQGIIALYLERQDEASVLLSNKSVKVLDIESLASSLSEEN